MLSGVKILNSSDLQSLTDRILELVNRQGYKLVGPVAAAVTLANEMRYVATLVREDKETE